MFNNILYIIIYYYIVRDLRRFVIMMTVVACESVTKYTLKRIL